MNREILFKAKRKDNGEWVEGSCVNISYIGWQFDGHWSGDVSGTKARCIAWHPLPEPYRQKEVRI